MISHDWFVRKALPGATRLKKVGKEKLTTISKGSWAKELCNAADFPRQTDG